MDDDEEGCVFWVRKAGTQHTARVSERHHASVMQLSGEEEEEEEKMLGS